MKKWFSMVAGISLLTLGTVAQACVLTAWDGGSSGDAATYGPDITTGTSRITGSCSMRVASGYVQDNSPTAEATYRARFYVLAQSGAGTADVLTAYSDEAGATPMFVVDFDGTNFTVDASAAGGGTSGAVAGAAGWNSVEINWVAGGNIDVWVNTDATTDAADASTGAGAGSIGSVRLGAQAPTGSLVLVADEFESRRTTAVGRVCPGDVVTPFGDRDLGDVLEVFVEASTFGGTLVSAGHPDFDENGGVDLGDVISLFGLASAFLGACN